MKARDPSKFEPIFLDVAALAANMVPTTLEQAYQKLSLQPLDDFVLSQVQENLQRPGVYTVDSEGRYRRIGASTWMCVRAALAILNGSNVEIQARDTMNAARLFKETMDSISFLHPKVTLTRASTQAVSFNNPTARLTWHEVPFHSADTHDADLTARLRGVQIFNDEEWKDRTIRLALGPCAMTQEIRLVGGRYYGYDEDGERLLELTAEGAATLAREPRPKPVKLVGFFVTTDPQPVVTDPGDDVSNIFGPPDPPPVKARIVPHVPVSRILDMGGANATRGYSTSPWASLSPHKGKKKPR